MVTSKEIAAYLGVSAGFVRRVIAEQRIEPVGRKGRAHLYRVSDIIRHTGARDRLATTL